VSRTVVVTGASRGIGAAISAAFAAAGDEVVGLDLEAPAEPLAGVRHVTADVSDQASVAAAFAQVEHLDVLVNNAGIQGVGLVGEQDVGAWLDVVQANLHGAYFCAANAVGRMSSGGAIVSVSSTAAFLGLPGRAAYCTSKAGLLALTRVLAVELAPRGIRANAICPGFTHTDLVGKGIDEGWLDTAWMTERIPMDRLATPAEIASAACFLAAPDAGYVTGSTLVVDGGWTVQGIGRAPEWLAHAG